MARTVVEIGGKKYVAVRDTSAYNPLGCADYCDLFTHCRKLGKGKELCRDYAFNVHFEETKR